MSANFDSAAGGLPAVGRAVMDQLGSQMEANAKAREAERAGGGEVDGLVGEGLTGDAYRTDDYRGDDPSALPEEMAGEAVDQVSMAERLTTMAFVVVPMAGVVIAMATLWGYGVEMVHVVTLAVMYVLTALGVSVGYHRLFSHKAFKTPTFMRVAFAILGAMAAEGTVRRFVATHRRHHSHSDRPGDPHSPHARDKTQEEHDHEHDHDHEPGVWGTVRGFWFAHMGWFLRDRAHPDEAKYAPEYCEPSAVRFIDRTNGLWVALGLLIPALVAYAWAGTLTSAALGLLWGGVVRIFIVHHVTWSINSVCHLWGTRPFKSRDHSRNNAIFGYLGLGEGWHNNHHAFPYSSRHGLRWWEFDLGYVVIRSLKAVGLAWDVRVPPKSRLEAMRAS